MQFVSYAAFFKLDLLIFPSFVTHNFFLSFLLLHITSSSRTSLLRTLRNEFSSFIWWQQHHVFMLLSPPTTPFLAAPQEPCKACWALGWPLPSNLFPVNTLGPQAPRLYWPEERTDSVDSFETSKIRFAFFPKKFIDMTDDFMEIPTPYIFCFILSKQVARPFVFLCLECLKNGKLKLPEGCASEIMLDVWEGKVEAYLCSEWKGKNGDLLRLGEV